MTRALVWFLVTAAYFRQLESSSVLSVRGMEGMISIEPQNPSNSLLKVNFRPNLKNKKIPQKNLLISSQFMKNPSSFLSSASTGLQSKESGWPLVSVSFNHPIQSPVDLVTSKAIDKDLPMLDIIEPPMKNIPAKFYNSGHTVYVYVKEDVSKRPYLTGGPLKEKFHFEQMHFHWGNEDIWGSEHFIDGESYAVEIHMVHYNSKYATFEDAAKEDDGLAVLTVFAEATSTDNDLLNPLYELLNNVTTANSSVLLDSNEAMQWAFSALSTNPFYYTYPGSLTTKPFSENVVFILLPKPITMSVKQLQAFRGLHSAHEGCITDNKRQLQPLHNRPIVRSYKLQ